MPIQPKQPTAKGPAEWFTGDVFIDAIARGEEPSRVRVSAVRFHPCGPHRLARQWHWHGAAPDHLMTHLCITKAPTDQRPEADWGDHVTDDQYHNR
jgi:quercetin dioxygenase-like cupin family protein